MEFFEAYEQFKEGKKIISIATGRKIEKPLNPNAEIMFTNKEIDGEWELVKETTD